MSWAPMGPNVRAEPETQGSTSQEATCSGSSQKSPGAFHALDPEGGGALPAQPSRGGHLSPQHTPWSPSCKLQPPGS